MKIKWGLMAFVFDALTAVQRVGDQFGQHLLREFAVFDAEFEVGLLKTSDILQIYKQ